MKTLAADLLAENTELAVLCDRMTMAQWQRKTAFHGWTPWDEIAHLCLLDEAGTLAATDETAFMQRAAQLRALRAQGQEISAIARATYADKAGPELVHHWRNVFVRMVNALAALEPKARLPWFGPTMSARSFAAARLMETWAHGQDIYDVLQQKRTPSLRLKHIAYLGVNTFGWSFQNRGLTVPSHTPHVALQAPDGSTWSWHTPSETDFVRGTAEDFCAVVTQRRHVADTGLVARGSATDWLQVAQCFAGPPVDGPAPGQR